MYTSQHVKALFISLASSTDNFLIGLSVGLTRKPLSSKVLWGIALCNAAGCLVATSGGSLGVHYLMDERTANVIACIAFAYLAWNEYSEVSFQETTSSPPRQVSLDLALPMTLNNLAGGVAAGVVGVSPLWNFAYALLMSAVTMWIGFQLGMVFSSVSPSRGLITYGPIVLYSALSLQSLLDARG